MGESFPPGAQAGLPAVPSRPAHRREVSPVSPGSQQPPFPRGSPRSAGFFYQNTSYIVLLPFPAFMHAKLGFPGNVPNKVCSVGIANATLSTLTWLVLGVFGQGLH